MRELVTSNTVPITPMFVGNGTHTLVVDGNYLMKASFEATQHNHEFINTRGKHYGGLYMFMTTLRKFVRDLGVNKVIVMWDGENGGQLRHDIYPDYKANRAGKKWSGTTTLTEAQIREQERSRRTMLSQRQRVKEYLEELFIRQVEIDIIEGDDLIAYYCQRYHKEEKITVFSNDGDMLILVQYDNVNVYLPSKKKAFNKSNYYLHFPYHYSNACLLKTICGCSADNIKGIVNMGETTLLNNFPGLKDRTYSYLELIVEAENINKARESGKGKEKKKRLKVLDSLVKGESMRWNPRKGEEEPKELGMEFFEINEKIVDLQHPMMRPEDIEELELNAESPLSIEDRGSKNLLALANQDSFLSTFGENFVKYVEPFYPVILREKKLTADSK